MSEPLVTILVPHYKTLTLTKLCLRLLRKYTDPTKAKVIVIDNDSNDESLDYLRQLQWIQFIERKSIPGESPALSHSRALDLALETVSTPYVLSIHTDTLVKRSDWLPFLLSHLEADSKIAGVGSWKLEYKSKWRRALKLIEDQMKLFYFRMIGKENHAIQGVGKNYYYLRSHCALYRTALLRQFKLGFSDEEMVAGKAMHQALLNHGYQMKFLSSEALVPYLEHVNHATTVLNPELSSREKSVKKGLRRIEISLNRVGASHILKDDRLDS